MIVKLLFFSSLLMFISTDVNSQDVGFPEKPDENPLKRNSKKKVPVYMPTQCGENELLYPGDQGNDWVCDCYPTYVFDPKSMKCHPVHMQGPCPTGQILILPKNNSIPACVHNDCPTNFVKYRHQNGIVACERLKDPTPCRYFNSPIPYVIGVNETTLKVACVPEERGSIIVQETLLETAIPKQNYDD